MKIQVKDFMSSPVITAMSDHSISEIREIMKENDINAMPVIAYANDTLKVDMTIEGVITSTDISKGFKDSTLVKDVMSATNVLVVHPNTNAKSAAKMMLKQNKHHVVVMNDGKVEGMISSLDFVRLVAEYKLE